MKTIQIPRCYFSQDSPIVEVQLRAFSDASKKAFAAVLYMRVTYSNGRVQTSPVTSKTRVALIKRQTIPQLELLAYKEDRPGCLLGRFQNHTLLDSKRKAVETVHPKQSGQDSSTDKQMRLATLPSERKSRGFPFTQYDRNRVGGQFNLVEWTVFPLSFRRMAARSAYNRSK